MVFFNHFTTPSSLKNIFRFLSPPQPPKLVVHEISLDFAQCPPPDKSSDTLPPPRVPPAGIPIEVVLIILDAAYFDDNNRPDMDLLRNCSLVSSAWSIHAQKLLFRRIRIRSQRAFASFIQAVDRTSHRGRLLSDAVIQIRAIFDHTRPECLNQLSLAIAVTHCPNLYALDIAQYGYLLPAKDLGSSPSQELLPHHTMSFDDRSLALLRDGPRIMALHIKNWSETDQSVLQLLHVWPSLRSLSITGSPPVLPPGEAYPHFPCALEELRVNCQKEPPKEFFTWLLHRSAEKNSLRVIDLERQPSPELFDYLIEKHGETLHSLSIPSFTMHDHAHAAMRCRALRELRTESSWSSPVIYRQMPDSIQHLSFGLDLDTVLNPIIDLVKTRDDLRALTVIVWRDGDHHPQLACLKMACAYRGVDLRLMRDVLRMRLMVRGDPVVPLTYPRFHALANMQPAFRS